MNVRRGDQQRCDDKRQLYINQRAINRTKRLGDLLSSLTIYNCESQVKTLYKLSVLVELFVIFTLGYVDGTVF